MTALGQTQTSGRIRARSVLPPTTDMRRLRQHVRLVPTAEMRGEAKRLANLLIRQHAKEANAGD